MDHYTALPTQSFSGAARLCTPEPGAQQETPDSPASRVMTDLTQVPAVVIQPHASMEAAHELMQQRGVRLLGEKPMHLVHERRIHHSDLLVSDVMTPAARLDAFDWKAVQAARVGNVVARLRLARRQHALVTQTLDGQVQVRGIISLSQIARQLGIALQLPEAADSFAEIEAALVAL
jgi:CBS domain-containing protein